jgi:CRP/FNR family cyclic AMP-dependent transcriptional regulator
MARPPGNSFEPSAVLAQAGLGRKLVQFKARQAIFSQGEAADSIFYLQSGRAKLTVVSQHGKEAIITLFAVGDFLGEETLATVGGLRQASALGDHPKPAIDDQVKSGHREKA